MKKIILCLMLTVPWFSPVAAEESLREALRGQTFGAADSALVQANRASASTLAPETYRAAAAAYKKAEAAFADGSDLERVRKLAKEAEQTFAQAAATAPVVKNFVDAAFQARLDALGVEAKTRAPDTWQKAELQFYEAASRAEQGRESRVMRFADNAEALYREAELAAIETALFSEIEREITAARKLDADDWAPKSYSFAVDLLSQARAELAANRYDTDRPRDLATQAFHSAKHAQYVARLADDIDDDDATFEDILFAWEDAIRTLAVDLDQPIYFDAGPVQAIAQMRDATAQRAASLETSIKNLSDSQDRVRRLEDELLQLQVALEGQESATSRADERLAQHEQRARMFQRVENTFAPEEAQVLRVKDRLIIRLVGLSYASGSSTIETQYYPVLAKLQQALEVFPKVPITIEGHTDSHGVDGDNMILSNARSEAVASYLVANTAISPALVTAVGFGESRPIANNETAEGRARNRRIDVVLYP